MFDEDLPAGVTASMAKLVVTTGALNSAAQDDLRARRPEIGTRPPASGEAKAPASLRPSPQTAIAPVPGRRGASAEDPRGLPRPFLTSMRLQALSQGDINP